MKPRSGIFGFAATALCLSFLVGCCNQAVVPTPTTKPYVETEVERTLNDLFENWQSGHKAYALYFLLLPKQIHIAEETAKEVLQKPPGTTYTYYPYNLNSDLNDIGISVVVPRTIYNQPPFQPSDQDMPNASIFVELDGFGYPVPEGVAQLMENCFVDGFVTRLFLESCVTTWKNLPGYGTAGSLNPSLGDNFTNSAGSLEYLSDYNNFYKNLPGKTLRDDITYWNTAYPITGKGMLYGWHAADDLIKYDTPDHRLLKDAWRLLHYQYSFEKFGTMVAFTLDYLAGEAQNERIQQIVSGQTTPAYYIYDLNGLRGIVYNVKTKGTGNSAKKLLADFRDVLTGEFYAISTNTNLRCKAKLELLGEYEAFLRGFMKGSSKAESELYSEISAISFNFGYDLGFNDGYSAGYAAGYQDGDAAGSAAAWAAANQVISNLQLQVSSLQSALTQAQAAANSNSGGGGGSGGGFWNTISNIAGDVGQVASVIGSIASLF
jgi:hypothetical protein